MAFRAEVRNLEKAFAGRSVLKGISFDLQKGERSQLVGACNGSGANHPPQNPRRSRRSSTTAPAPSLCLQARPRPCRPPPPRSRADPPPPGQPGLRGSPRNRTPDAPCRRGHEQTPRSPLGTTKPIERYTRYETEIQPHAGLRHRPRVDAVLHELGFSERDLDTPIKFLSGGQKIPSSCSHASSSKAPISCSSTSPPTTSTCPCSTGWKTPSPKWKTPHWSSSRTIATFSTRSSMKSSTWSTAKSNGHIGNYSSYTELKAHRQLTQQRALRPAASSHRKRRIHPPFCRRDTRHPGLGVLARAASTA